MRGHRAESEWRRNKHGCDTLSVIKKRYVNKIIANAKKCKQQETDHRVG